jgi:anthranilate phosphoribosyltransferase
MAERDDAADLHWPDLIERVLAGGSLDAATSEAALRSIMHGGVDPAVVGGFLVALRAKGETTDEIVGLARAMRSMATPFPVDTPGTVLDTCGTGGDRSGTVNVSTMAAVVCAAAGVRVVKHGNRAASSRSGSADVLESLGVVIDLAPPEALECLGRCGITFLFAPAYHPALGHVMPARRALGVRTVFNVLGPLANPAGVGLQVLGVPDPAIGERMAEALAALGVRRAFVVHGADGLDELSTTGVNRVWEVDAGVIRTWELDPQGLGLPRAALSDLAGGDAEDNAEVVRRVLAGEAGPVRDIVVLNAGAGLVVAGLADDVAAGVARAASVIDDGTAAGTLAHWVATSRSLSAD